MSEDKQLSTDEYDAKHGKPEATPDAPPISEGEAWGTSLNPVRDDSLPAKGLKEVGK